MANQHRRRGAFVSTIFTLLTLACATSALSISESSSSVAPRQLASLLSPYAPKLVDCPSTPLARDSSTGISDDEAKWANARKKKATKAFKTWLARQGDFPTVDDDQIPMIALATGGGGLRGFLTGAGVHKAFDDKEGLKYTTSGLYQAITYETALSGSSIMLGSLAGSNQPTVSTIYSQLWETAIANGLFEPDKANNGQAMALAGIVKDVTAKMAAGSQISTVDPFGRLLGYTAFQDDRGGVSKHISDILTYSAYKNHDNPFPMFGSLGVEKASQGCGLPPKNATQYEFTPLEFGSFDKDINVFTPVEFMGTPLNNGKPTNALGKCTSGFDNMAFVIGTSTNINNQRCGTPQIKVDDLLDKAGLKTLTGLTKDIFGAAITPLFSFIPNPAKNVASAPKTSKISTLKLIDGGENIQVDPIFSILYRPEVKLLFVNDNSADNHTNLPDGRQIHNTFVQAHNQGVGNRMPAIPKPPVFAKNGYEKNPAFFGCNLSPTSPAMTIVWIPNTKYTFDSAQSTNRTTYTPADSLGMINNGIQVATFGENKEWGFCVGCVAMKRAAQAAGKALPSKCASCFKKYCFN